MEGRRLAVCSLATSNSASRRTSLPLTPNGPPHHGEAPKALPVNCSLLPSPRKRAGARTHRSIASRHMIARRTPLRVGLLTLKRAADASIDERRSAVSPESAMRELFANEDSAAWVRLHDDLRGIPRFSPPTRPDVEAAKRAIAKSLRNAELLAFRAQRRGGMVPVRLFDDGSSDASSRTTGSFRRRRSDDGNSRCGQSIV